MLAAGDTFVDISDKLYVDVYNSIKFEVDLIFNCVTSIQYNGCSVEDILEIRHRFGDIFGLEYIGSVSVECVSSVSDINAMTITVSISTDVYETTLTVNASANGLQNDMESILSDIDGISASEFVHHVQRTSFVFVLCV